MKGSKVRRCPLCLIFGPIAMLVLGCSKPEEKPLIHVNTYQSFSLDRDVYHLKSGALLVSGADIRYSGWADEGSEANVQCVFNKIPTATKAYRVVGKFPADGEVEIAVGFWPNTLYLSTGLDNKTVEVIVDTFITQPDSNIIYIPSIKGYYIQVKDDIEGTKLLSVNVGQKF